jgi:hypothetical protein
MNPPIAPEVRSKQPSFRTADASARPRSIGPTQSEAISPELALVSPELAEVARLRLPDPPWEVALRRAGVSRVRNASEDGPWEQTSSPVPEAATTPIAHVGSSVLPSSDLFDDELDERTRRWRVRSALILVAAIAIAVISVLLGLDVWKRGNGESVLTTPSAPDTLTDTPVDTQSPLVPSAGYVVSPGGSLLTDASGRRIASFTLPLRCGDARQLVIRDIPLSGRSLRVSTRAVGRAITVRLTGRILRRDRLRGVVSAAGPACSADPVAFVARLS